MSRKGNCWDNAVAESFFGSLKKERIKKQIYKTRALAQADVKAYINTFYNQTRRHSYLGGLSPEQFEAAHKPRRQGLHLILGAPSFREFFLAEGHTRREMPMAAWLSSRSAPSQISTTSWDSNRVLKNR
jgi:putative transposase